MAQKVNYTNKVPAVGTNPANWTDEMRISSGDMNSLKTVVNANADELTEVGQEVAGKASLESPTFTGTVSGISKSMVGLGNVDNTTDANKPVSTATQTALNTKAPLASPALTGTPTTPDALDASNDGQIANTKFVKTTTAKIPTYPYTNSLVNKKVVVLSDSFGSFGSFPPIQYKLKGMGMVVINSSISGTQIVGGTNPATSRIDAAIDTNPDILIIAFGSNDWLNRNIASPIPLGDINSPDATTYYGAWKEVIRKAVTKNPYIFVVPINMCPRGNRSDYESQKPYANAVIEVANYYGIKALDIFKEGGFTYENLSFMAPDGVHPVGGYGLDLYSSHVANFITERYLYRYATAPTIVYQKQFTDFDGWTVQAGATIVQDEGISKARFTANEIQKSLAEFLVQGDLVRVTLTGVRVQSGRGHAFFSGVDKVFHANNGSTVSFVAPYPSSGSALIYLGIPGSVASPVVFVGGIIIEKL